MGILEILSEAFLVTRKTAVLEKSGIPQPIKIFSVFCGITSYIFVFRTAKPALYPEPGTSSLHFPVLFL